MADSKRSESVIIRQLTRTGRRHEKQHNAYLAGLAFQRFVAQHNARIERNGGQ